MDKKTAYNLAQEIEIAVPQVVREEYEMIVLNELSGSKLGEDLIFKGGTALRLAYQSPRFSEDLDFSPIGKVPKFEELQVLCQGLAKRFPSLTLYELRDKYFTIFAIFKIFEPYLAQRFSIKVEISKRKVNWLKNKDYKKNLLSSPATPIKCFAWVVTPERMFKEKKRMIKERIKARDLFDLWYLGQILKRKITLPKKRFDYQKVKSELNQFLPKNYRRVIKELV